LQIDRLIVVAGYPATGKTTFISRLLADRLPSASEALAIGDSARWEWAEIIHFRTIYRMQAETRANAIPQLLKRWRALDPRCLASFDGSDAITGLQIERLVLHFDLMSSVILGHASYSEDAVLVKLLAAAAEIEIVTLWAEPWLLKKRMLRRKSGSRRRRADPAGRSVRRFFGLERRPYRRVTREKITSRYDAWFDFTSGIPEDSHWIAHSVGEPILLPGTRRAELLKGLASRRWAIPRAPGR